MQTLCCVLEVQRREWVVSPQRLDKWAPSSLWWAHLQIPFAVMMMMMMMIFSHACPRGATIKTTEPTIAINPVTQLLTWALSRWHSLTLNSHNCSFPFGPTWGWCHQGAGEEVMSESLRGRPGQREMAALILVLRNVMCVRSCETPPALRITFRKALATWPGSSGGHVLGQKARLCWQQRFKSIHNSRSSNPLGTVFPLLLVLKNGVHTGKAALTLLPKA